MLAVGGITVRFGGITALDDVGFTVEQGTAVGLIGPNGAGKTTLFDCLTRRRTPDSGTVSYQGEDLLALPPHTVAQRGIARTFQDLNLFRELTVRENVLVGAHHRGRAGYLTAALRLGRVRREEAELREQVDELLRRLDLTDVADRPATGLSYGVLKRVELARALAVRPRLLLLDEPVGGLNHGEIGEFSELISKIRRDLDLTLVVVEHHMGFVMGLCDQVVCLDFGRKIAEGPPEAVQRDPAVIGAYLGGAA